VSIPATLVCRPVTLDQLVALSDEIAALSRAGVPLDRGLRELGRDLPGRLGNVAGEIGRRLEGGESFSKIAGSGGLFPPAYQAVIEAGLRVGHLPAAMEDIARTGRRIRHLRTTIGTALLYPVIVLLLAWQLFVYAVIRVLPTMLQIMEQVYPAAAEWQAVAARLAATSVFWGWAVPLAFVAWVAWVWYRSGRVAAGVELHPLLAWGGLGVLRRMQRAGRMAALTDLLGMLVTHRVPLDEAVTLASAAVGSPRLAASGRELAERIRRGQIGGSPPEGFSPLVTWTLTCGRSDQLAKMLFRTAQLYRDEFNRRGQWLALYVPLFASVAVGGTVVSIYALISLGPWILIMHRLADPTIQ
jgi:general secretion pathway protein F